MGLPASDTDDDDDMDVSLFKARLAVAQKSLKAKDYKAAEAQFKLCVANTAVLKTLPNHVVMDLKLELASVYQASGNNAGHQAILLELLKQPDLPKVQTLHLQHLLAVAYFDGMQLELAHDHAEEAMRGRRKLFGRRHESYYESVGLLVDICEAQSNTEDAQVYRHLLREGYQKETTAILVNPSVDTTTIKLLTDNGYVINNEKTYFEALQWASNQRQQEIVRILLKRGPDFARNDEDYGMMLREAIRGGHDDIVQYLLEQEACIDAIPGQGETALGYAAELGKESITRLLLDRGAEARQMRRSNDVNSDNGDPALFRAAENGHESIVKLLLDRGALIDLKGRLGKTPLGIAASRAHLTVVRLLLDRGANVDAIDLEGATSLMSAAWRGRAEMTRLLLDRGADATLKTIKKKDTAMTLAKHRSHEDVVKILKSYRTGLHKLW
jgi:ankyrin repeat protein